MRFFDNDTSGPRVNEGDPFSSISAGQLKGRALIILVVLMATASLLAACQAATGGQVPEDFEVRLERGPCFGACPVYTMTVSADGGVAYEGQQFVEVEGSQTADLAEAEVTALFEAVEAADFFALDDSYTVEATDLPSITTTVTASGRTKTVYHYGLGCGTALDSAPAGLCALEALLEGIPAANGWVAPAQ